MGGVEEAGLARIEEQMRAEAGEARSENPDGARARPKRRTHGAWSAPLSAPPKRPDPSPVRRSLALAPAYFTKPLVQQILEDRTWYEDVVGRVPQGRFRESWEIIGPAVFLTSQTSDFVTGTTLLVDGGWIAA